jgi:ubiquinone/menaquinone biosynthesis C-methylase UbiE
MTGSGAPVSDAVIVRKLNQIFYDVEAEQYDERHPEVIEGDADWWLACAAKLIGALRAESDGAAALRVLDVGCGTGFVPGLLAGLLGEDDLVIGLDQSEGMLARARSKMSTDQRVHCRLTRGDAASLQFRGRSFDMVTVNSLLHHVYDYRAVLREIDRVLKPGGYLVLAHEPNREFFQSRLVRLAGSAWKLAGFGMTVPPDICARINARLRAARLTSAEVDPDHILRMVEYHSPVEQGALRIDPDKGFLPRDLLAEDLRGYTLIEITEYSTFYHRPLLERHQWLLRVAKGAATVLRGKGNLFSAVLRKAPPRQ